MSTCGASLSSLSLSSYHSGKLLTCPVEERPGLMSNYVDASLCSRLCAHVTLSPPPCLQISTAAHLNVVSRLSPVTISQRLPPGAASSVGDIMGLSLSDRHA